MKAGHIISHNTVGATVVAPTVGFHSEDAAVALSNFEIWSLIICGALIVIFLVARLLDAMLRER